MMLGVCSTSPRPWKGLEKVRDPFAFSRRRENGGASVEVEGEKSNPARQPKKKKTCQGRAWLQHKLWRMSRLLSVR